MIGIDADHCFCPEFTVPVLRLIKSRVPPGQSAVIKTREPRAIKRVTHLCESYDWKVKGYKEDHGHFYIAIKC